MNILPWRRNTEPSDRCLLNGFIESFMEIQNNEGAVYPYQLKKQGAIVLEFIDENGIVLFPVI